MSMSPRNLLRFLAVGTVSALAATTLVSQPVAADAVPLLYRGSASSTYITALDGTVVSGPTTATGLQTSQVPFASSNDQVDADVLSGVLAAKALSTSSATSKTADGGSQVQSISKAAGVSLLKGLIKLNAVTTTSTVSVDSHGLASYEGHTELLGLIVNGRKIPINVAKNTAITLPGIAKITLNQTKGENTSDLGAKVQSAGITVELLKARQTLASGTTILVTPTEAAIAPNITTEGATLAGTGYALKASVKVGGVVRVLAGPFAAQYVTPGGTAGKDVDQDTVKAKLSPILTAGVVGTTVNGSRTPTHSEVTVNAHAAKVNLLGGAIMLDAITSTSHAARDANASQPTVTGDTEIVNLRLAGKPIKIAAEPNTTIDVAGLGTVILNQQFRTANGLVVRGLVVVLSVKKLGLPIGAEVELATTLASALKDK
jgi:hypothetical protein